MGEHRVDELAARKQPLPRPLTGPVDVLDRQAGEPSERRRVSQAPRNWSRRVSRWLRTKKGRWTLITFTCLTVLLLGLLIQGFFSSPAPSIDPGAVGGGAPSAHPLTPSSSPAKGKKGAGDGQLVDNPLRELRQAFPDNPLNHLNTGQLHNVSIDVTSPGRMAVVGFLVPTGLGESYGSRNGQSGGVHVSQQALGGGYLAAVFIQTDKAGTPITCTVTVDGKVTSSQTASAPYARALCLG